MNRAARLLTRVLDYGTETYPKSVARRLRQVNWFNLFLILAYLVFAVFYALVDWNGLKLLSAAILAAVPFFFLTPFFHRLGDAAATTYLVFHLTNSFLVFCSIVGSAAGVHYWLLAAGALVVFFGTRRIHLALLMVCCLAGLFLLIEFRFPHFTEYAPISPTFAAVMKSLAVIGEALIVAGFVYLALRMAEAAESELEREYDRSENLLLNLMPSSIAARLKQNPDAIIADHFEEVTILFADIVDFTPRAGRLAPDELVRFLNRVFSEFDMLELGEARDDFQISIGQLGGVGQCEAAQGGDAFDQRNAFR